MELRGTDSPIRIEHKVIEKIPGTVISDIGENIDKKQKLRLLSRLWILNRPSLQQSSQRSEPCITNMIYLHLVAARYYMPIEPETKYKVQSLRLSELITFLR